MRNCRVLGDVTREALLVGRLSSPSSRFRPSSPQLLEDDQSLRTQHVEAINLSDHVLDLRYVKMDGGLISRSIRLL